MADKCYRVGESLGPDYVCSSCKRVGRRLWRQTNTLLVNIDLLCAECAERDQAEEIKEYSSFHQPHSTTIGDLVPARPTPDGSTFWGHASGDVEWWYRLPQYPEDPVRELERVRLERDLFVGKEQYAIADWLHTLKDNSHLRQEISRLLALLEKGNFGGE